MGFNTMPRRKDISSNVREAIIAAHQSGKGYKTISKQLGVHHSTVRMIIHNRENTEDRWQSSQ